MFGGWACQYTPFGSGYDNAPGAPRCGAPVASDTIAATDSKVAGGVRPPPIC